MTNDLVQLAQFLRDRYDEEVALALAAKGATRSAPDPDGHASWQASDDGGGVLYDAGTRLLVAPGAEPGMEWTAPALSAHVARHNPARVLADVEAKRQIVDGIAGADPEGSYITSTFTAWDALRLFALPYADHPDYREEWRL